MPPCLILTTFSWPFGEYCRKTTLFHGVLSEKLSIRPSAKTLDIPTVLRYNDSIVRNKEENEMLVLECFAVLITIAILITPAPEVE